METKIIEDKKQPLFSRREITAEIAFPNKTPSRLDVRKSLANALKAKEDSVVVRSIKTNYGFRNARVMAHVYSKKEDIGLEPKYIIKRHVQKTADAGKPEEQSPTKEEKPAKVTEKKDDTQAKVEKPAKVTEKKDDTQAKEEKNAMESEKKDDAQAKEEKNAMESEKKDDAQAKHAKPVNVKEPVKDGKEKEETKDN